MLIKEYRIVLPISVEEYKVGQLYAVAEASKNETGGGEGVEVLENKPYEKEDEKGQYTHKIYHLKSKVPALIRVIAPKGSLELHEKAWNAYPYCKTILTNEFMKDKFEITIETWHKSDLGENDSVHQQKNTEVVHIDIADKNGIPAKEYKKEEDPAKFKSEKTGRGPLEPDWKTKLATSKECPHMCAYKLVSVHFQMMGFQSKMEDLIHSFEKRVFTKFHRQLFCWLDKWIELDMDAIRQLENETKAELDKMIKTEEVRGSLPE